MTITEFLEARIAEDEKLAEEASISMHGQRHTEAWDYASYVLSSERDATEAQDKFVTEWWPARVLAECAAKRAIIALHYYEWMGPDDAAGKGCQHDYEDWPCPTIRAIAAVYADHPDYVQEWA